jgi:hypothetical protein
MTHDSRLVSLLLSAGLVAGSGCQISADPDHPAFNRYEAGSQLNGSGELVVWLGEECHDITSIQFELGREGARIYDTWTIRSKSKTGATIGSFTPGVVPEGFREVDPLRGDWRDAYATSMLVRSAESQTAAYMSVSSFLEEAEDRGSDEWYVQEEGWYTQDEYREDLVGADNADVYPMCTTRN